MQVAMAVEDRDSGFLFLDPTHAPKGCQLYELSLGDGVLFSDIEDDDKVVWLASDTTIRVVLRDSVDFENDPFDNEWPVPSCTLCLTEADYKALQS